LHTCIILLRKELDTVDRVLILHGIVVLEEFDNDVVLREVIICALAGDNLGGIDILLDTHNIKSQNIRSYAGKTTSSARQPQALPLSIDQVSHGESKVRPQTCISYEFVRASR